jgi:hypothetical protein
MTETASLLHEVARQDGHGDAHVSARLAALVDAVGRGYREVPREVAVCAMAAVAAVDRATAHRRS